MIKLGYTLTNSDYFMFTLIKDGHTTVLLVYVDDVILVGTSLQEFDRIKQILHNAFKIKDLGKLKYLLGLEVAYSKEGIVISQRMHCLDLLKDIRLLASKPVNTPLNPSIKYTKTKTIHLKMSRHIEDSL